MLILGKKKTPRKEVESRGRDTEEGALFQDKDEYRKLVCNQKRVEHKSLLHTNRVKPGVDLCMEHS